MIKLESITKKYSRGNTVFTALDLDVLEIGEGDYLAINGPSGAGKSTLLNIIGGLIKPDTGTVSFNGQDIYGLSSREKDFYRKREVGFVFQQFHLMPYLTVLENIRMACFEKNHFERIEFYLQKCAIAELKNKYPSELSVGEKQRAAFIRAIIKKPSLLLADEPTGNLDVNNSEILMGLIRDYHKEGGTVIVVSHHPDMARHATKKLWLEKGKLVREERLV